MSLQTNLFINNEHVPSSTNSTLTILNPSTDALVSSSIQVASEADVDAAVAAAVVAFPAWRSTPAAARAAAMLKLADLIEAHTPELARLESIAMGAPISVAKQITALTGSFWRYYAGSADKITGESMPPDGDGTYKLVNYEPLGVCAGIAAWNATPLYWAWKIAPAVAAGNTVVFKASEKSPLGTLFLGTLIVEAGFPPGVINFVTGGGAVGAQLAAHMSVAKIAFTGSTAVGRLVQLAAAKSNLKHVSLELGGKSPALVFDDCDIEKALEHNSQGFLLNSGQICSAATRILVQEGVAEKFIEGLKAAFEKFSGAMGDAASEQVYLGPLADRAQFERVMGFLAQGKRDGVKVLVGGVRKGEVGQFVEPTVLLDQSGESKVYTDEIFGPVAVVRTFKTEEEGVQMANQTSYGLSSTIFTSDVARALRVAGQIEAGTVGVNATFFPSVLTPFGGFKQSGYGREGGKDGLREYLQAKTVHINVK